MRSFTVRFPLVLAAEPGGATSEAGSLMGLIMLGLAAFCIGYAIWRILRGR